MSKATKPATSDNTTLSYVGTEYLLEDNGVTSKNRSSKILQSKSFHTVLAIVVLLNVIDRVTGAAEALNGMLQGFLHLPKVLFAAIIYQAALYWDCKRVSPVLTVGTFMPLVGKAFCRVLPAYPFLAVVISFGFMIVINIFEALHLPLELLNWPIYYGTLYGPFSFVYWKVKERVVEDACRTLPSVKTPW